MSELHAGVSELCRRFRAGHMSVNQVRAELGYSPLERDRSVADGDDCSEPLCCRLLQSTLASCDAAAEWEIHDATTPREIVGQVAYRPVPLCCWMNQTTFAPCGAPAEWEIHTEDDTGPVPSSYNVTCACTAHVGKMLTDAYEHRVYPVHSSLPARPIVAAP